MTLYHWSGKDELQCDCKGKALPFCAKTTTLLKSVLQVGRNSDRADINFVLQWIYSMIT